MGTFFPSSQIVVQWAGKSLKVLRALRCAKPPSPGGAPAVCHCNGADNAGLECVTRILGDGHHWLRDSGVDDSSGAVAGCSREMCASQCGFRPRHRTAEALVL
eukprot:4647970-Pyramimonas_sp.AAC.1